MFLKSSLLLTLAGAWSAAALPSGMGSSEPCQKISKIYQQSTVINPSIPGELAYECLSSMPFDASRSAALIEDVKKYINWQTTVDVLRNPPSVSRSSKTDLLGGLEMFAALVQDGDFSNQFEFDSAIQRLLWSANDGHLGILSMCSLDIFNFYVNFPVVSVSTDGLKLPKIYTMSDASLLASHPNRVSHITSINGQDAVAFFNMLASTQGYQDPDARYNAMFNNNGRLLLPGMTAAGAWQNPVWWPGGKDFTVRFANGTTTGVNTTAQWTNFFPSTTFPSNGKALFQEYCVPSSTSGIPTPSAGDPLAGALATPLATPLANPSATPVNPSRQFYPQPVMSGRGYGYYLHEQDMQDVAVLRVPTFQVSEPFADSATKFFEGAKAAGKKKLLIDLSNNGGGITNAGFDLFKLLFPSKLPHSATRFRDHESVNLIGKALSQISMTQMTQMFLGPWTVLALSASVTPNQTHGFQTWKEVYGPFEELGTNLSALHAEYNFTLMSVPGHPIPGYGAVPLNEKSSPFAAEDILIMTDGECSSTCTIFVELMKNLAGVKTLAFGGRPQHRPMQALGGTKGAEDLVSSEILSIYKSATSEAEQAAQNGHRVLTDAEIQRLKELTPASTPPLKNFQMSVNFLNNYRLGEDNMPLQFVYEAADCRLFYTYENVVRPATSWVAAARAVWGNGSCVPASKDKHDC